MAQWLDRVNPNLRLTVVIVLAAIAIFGPGYMAAQSYDTEIISDGARWAIVSGVLWKLMGKPRITEDN